MPGLAQRLPEFPWDTLAQAKAQAGQHPGGIVDLSIGTPGRSDAGGGAAGAGGRG